jgi:hypothetical protein
MLDIDTVGFIADLEPCANPAFIDIEITEADAGVDYKLADLKAGTSEDVPIPGLDLVIPLVGSAGVVADIKVSGNADAFQLNLGLDACITSPLGKECGSDLVPTGLPVEIIQGDFSFGSVCGGWKCVYYTAQEVAEIKAGQLTQQQACNDHSPSTFTGGHNANYPGCGTCYCCAKN